MESEDEIMDVEPRFADAKTESKQKTKNKQPVDDTDSNKPSSGGFWSMLRDNWYMIVIVILCILLIGTFAYIMFRKEKNDLVNVGTAKTKDKKDTASADTNASSTETTKSEDTKSTNDKSKSNGGRSKKKSPTNEELRKQLEDLDDADEEVATANDEPNKTVEDAKDTKNIKDTKDTKDDKDEPDEGSPETKDDFEEDFE